MKLKRDYADKLRDPRWQRKRLEVFERDDYTCRDCSATDQELHVHHCFYDKGEPWEIDPSYLLTLCADCHKHRGKTERLLRRLIGQLCARAQEKELWKLVSDAFSLVKEGDAAVNGDIPIPRIVNDFELEWEANIRWWREAKRDVTFRPAYEKVTGTKPEWP